MRVVLLLAACVFSALGVAAQSPAKILKQAEKAIGGANAFRAVASLRKSGSVRRLSDDARGKITIQTARPNLYNISFDVGGFEIESGYNGKSSWVRDSKSGLRTLTGDPSVDFQGEAAFRNSLWLESKKERSKLVSGGKASVAGRPVNVITLNTPKGTAVRLSFDVASNLLLREEFSFGDATRTFEYSEHRPVGRLIIPHRMKMELDGVAYEADFDDVRPDAQIARSEFDFPKMSDEPLPDIPTLLQELNANEEKVEEILDTYSYNQRSTFRALDKDGVLRETDSLAYQLSFHKGYRMRRLIEKNGKPLTADEQEREDKEAAERVEEIEKRIAKQEAAGKQGTSDREQRISIAELLRASTLSNPRRERFRGRDVIVFDFEPNPSFDYKNAKSMLKFFGKTAGAMWIDEKDKQVARLEAFLADSFNIAGGVVVKLRKGASFTLEQERVNNEIWLPSVADINLSIRVFLVKGIDMNQVIRSYDYRKFSTEVKDAKVNPINP